MSNRKFINDKGFTLVELIVILIIVGILSTIITPGVVAYIDEAKLQQDIINAKVLMIEGQKLLDEMYNEGEEISPLFVDNTNRIPVLNTINNAFRINWSPNYSKRFKELTGLYTDHTGSASQQGTYDGYHRYCPYFSEECPYNVALIVGNYYEYYGKGDVNDPRVIRKAYTVYGILYQRTPESRAICFDGNQWITDLKGKYPFDYDKSNPSTIVINGKKIRVTEYWINGFVHPSNPSKVNENIYKKGYSFE